MTDKQKLGYISACADYETEQVLVWERGPTGRKMIRYDAPYYFYVEDDKGKHTSLFGHTLTRLDFDCKAEFEAAKFKHERRFESDINPTAKVLMNEYYQAPTPSLNYTFLDIEVDYDRNIGFSSPENPYAPINAITLYHQWLDEFVTIVVPPKGWKGDIVKQFDEMMPEIKTNLIIAKDEAELIYSTLDLIDDSDLISGWNSEFFDLPYLLKRTEMVLGRKAMNRWCFLGALPPRFDTVERFGKEQINASLSGRIHLDYLALFKKFTFEGRVSFSLGAIAEEELDIPKLEYEGTLEDLYKNDFIHFIKYNVRDTEILKRLDQKFKFIALANQMSHENTVPVEAVLGTVKYVETGIINYVHNVMNKVMPDKITRPNTGKVEGAIVMTPKVGLHEWVGSVDINSLYPSVIRSLNISSEKIIGQFTNKEEDWRGIWKKDDKIHLLEMENLDTFEATGAEWYDLLKQKRWAVSAYGTVFDQSSGQGAVPAVLTAWFAARKDLQKKKKEWSIKLKELIKSNAPEAEIAEAEKNVAHYDLLQHTKKISLNSAYGALLNAFFAFFDERMGASVTASGRQITTHMIETAGEILTGARDQLVKTTSVDKKGKVQHDYHIDSMAIIYSDTDSLTGDSLVKTNYGTFSLEDLFDACPIKTQQQGSKQFGEGLPNLKVLSFKSDEARYLNARSIYRHKVSKARWKVTLQNGKSVIVTNDHSIMVERDGELIEVKPAEILKTDIFISVKD